MTTALYRRYRPDTFAEVIGQDHVTGPLRAALRANKVTHAYLFSGPRGCGKTTSARILARCLNCAEGPTDTPCGVCDSCRELATGGAGSLDVVEIDAASHGGVDDARELREKATFAPVRDRYKVFIIDEAHMVTNQGFNALLKLVEEPPEHVKFVFATTEPDRVIGTIRSRTHHYPFRLVPPDVLGPYLHRLAEEEQVSIGQGVLPMVMRAGGGSVRDTLSVLDQLMAGSIDGEVSYETAVALLGYTDTALLDETVDALAGGDGAAAYRVVERMVESGHDPRRFVEDLLQRLRDLLIIAVAGDGAGDVLSDVPSDQFERMRHQAANWGPRNLSRAADLADEALRQMTGATSPRLQLELLIGRILVPPTRPAAQPIEESAVPGTVGTPGGGAPREDAGRFGAREAREALARSRRGGPTAPAAPDRPAPGRYEDAASAPTSGVAPAPVSDPRAAEPWPQALAPGANAPTSAPPEKPGAGPRADAGTGAAAAPSDGRSAVRTGPGAVGSPRTTPATPEGSAWPEVSTPAPAAPEPVRETQGPVRDAPAASEQVQQAAASTGRQADMIRGRWEDVLERLKAMSRVAWALVSGSSQLGAVDGSELVLIFPNDALAANFARKDHALVVAEAVYEVTGVRVSVSERVGQAAGGPAVSAPSALASDQDPQGQDGWVSEPPPFEPEQAPEAFSSQDGTSGVPAAASPHGGGAADVPARADTAEAAPSPALGEPDEETRAPEPSPSSAPPASSALDAPGSAAPGSARASAARSDGGAVTRAHVGYTNGPKRRAISVFTYDDADPEHAPGEAAEPRSQSPRADSATRPDEHRAEPEPRTEPDYRAEPSSTDWPEPQAAPAAPDASADGWGPVAVPGGASSSETPAWSPEPAQPWSPAPAWSPEPPAPRASDASAPWGPDAGSPAPPEPGAATPWETRSPASRPAMAGWSESPASPGGVSFEDSASAPIPNAARDEAAGAAGADDPADRTGGPRPGGAGAPSSTPPAPSFPGSDDSPSLDDEDIEVSTRFGVPAILDILGGTVIEEIYDEGSR